MPDRVGILGISAGGSLAVIAAADPRIQHRVGFITLFGGYYDATTLLRDFGRRAQDGEWHAAIVAAERRARCRCSRTP